MDKKKLKLITEEHKIKYMKAIQIQDKKEMELEANKVIELICKEIDWTENKHLVVMIMTNHMLETVTEVIDLVTKKNFI